MYKVQDWKTLGCIGNTLPRGTNCKIEQATSLEMKISEFDKIRNLERLRKAWMLRKIQDGRQTA